MFNIDFIAAQVGADINVGGNIFEYETVTSDSSAQVTLKGAPVPVVTGGTAYLWYRASSTTGDMTKMACSSSTATMPAANTEYCVMYRRAVNGSMVSVSSQFIPKTVHAILTVALYTGDSCNVTAATKAGSVVIDIPRLELSGAMDITSATCC